LERKSNFIDALKFQDYILADYRKADDSTPVNFYVAWYDSQRKGRSAHSPKTCIPGGGWEISDFDQKELTEVNIEGQPLRVNRAVIEYGNQKQLVYYWFQQRGRVLTNEYFVKWYLFWDSLTRNRSDGALVRLTTPIGTVDGGSSADARLFQFAYSVADNLTAYIPN
jgi:EpsI family protein